jgi:putative phosphoribosyl transferase
MRYEGRPEAGEVLAAELQHMGLGPAVVAGIPRGGLIVAGKVAELLGAPLTAVYARKLTSPAAPEFAFGALDEDGHALLDHRSVVTLGLGETEVERIRQGVAREIARRAVYFGSPRLADLLPGRTAVLVDDGLATGLTMQAAIGYVQRHGAEAVVVAVPCASTRAAYEAKTLLQREGDRFVCPLVDADFRAVGAYYREFPQVTDEQARDVLRAALERTLPGVR